MPPRPPVSRFGRRYGRSWLGGWDDELDADREPGYHEITRGWRCGFSSEASDREIEESETALARSFVIEKQRTIEAYKASMKERLISLSVGDNPASVELIRHWLQVCDTEHHDCHLPSEESVLPSRLLELIDEAGRDAVRVVVISKPCSKPRYLALSHCWGSSTATEMQQKITTTTNVTERMKDIPLPSLPQLYRDAIRMTRSLGERYLWIDSLCILQDSPDDWARESVIMGDIYTNAYCTLSADSSTGSNSTIFRARTVESAMSKLEISKYEPVYQPWGYLTPPTSSSTFYPEFHHWSDLVASEPLSSRGWTLQERQLSRRIVHFTSDQILWECAMSNASEVLPEGISNRPSREEMLATQPIGPACQKLLVEQVRTGSRSQEAEAKLWYWLVTKFTARHLTFPEDRLTALMGVAISLGHVKSGGYVAGLLRSDMATGLLWTRDSGSGQSHARLECAPSWSWASISGPVKFRVPIVVTPEYEILDIALDPFSPWNPAGRLKRGILVLRGSLKIPKVSNTEGNVHHVVWAEEGLHRQYEQRLVVEYDVDDDSDRRETANTIYYLLLSELAMGSETYMMLVKADQDREVYRRIGLCQSSAWSDSRPGPKSESDWRILQIC